MIYERLAGFVQHYIMMSCVYQPMTLLRREGASIEAAGATPGQKDAA